MGGMVVVWSGGVELGLLFFLREMKYSDDSKCRGPEPHAPNNKQRSFAPVKRAAFWWIRDGDCSRGLRRQQAFSLFP